MSNNKKLLIQKVDDLSQLLQDVDEESIKLNIQNFREEIEKDLTYNVTTLGEFSSGKSSMINKVFIGEDILPTKSTPTTAILTTIRYGKKKLLKINYKDGSIKEFTDNLAEVLEKSVSTNSNGDDPKGIKEAELFLPSDVFKEGVVIIDTPGLNDPNKVREEITLNYLDKSDSVIYLANSTAPWSRSVKEFVEENIFTKERAEKLFILLNYWDMIKEDEREEVYDYVRYQLEKSIDEVSRKEEIEKIDAPSLIPISAKTKEGIDKFKKVLFDFLLDIKGNKILEQKYAKFNILKSNISKIFEEKLSIQSNETEIINVEIEELQKEVDNFKKDVEIYKESIKPTIEIFINEWEEDIKEYYDDIKATIINKISLKMYTQKNETDVKNLIRTSVARAFSVNEDKLNNIAKSLNNKVNKFANEQKVRLKLNYHFIKQNNEKIKQKALENFKATNPNFKAHNQKSFLVVGGSIVASGLLATIATPLAIVGFAGFVYGEIMLKPELFKRDMEELMEDIDDQVTDITNRHKESIKNVIQNSVSIILNSISNDITEAYADKEKLYHNALDNREKNIENKVSQLLNNKLEEINKI